MKKLTCPGIHESAAILLAVLSGILTDGCAEKSVDVPVVSTAEINAVTQNSARCGGIISSDGGAEITSKGICWCTNHSPSVHDSRTDEGFDKASYKSDLSSLSPNTMYYVRAYAINRAGTGYGQEVSFTTLKEIEFSSANDIEGNTYKTVQIGAQYWFAENLKTTKYNDGTGITNVTDYALWGKLTTAAFCWVGNHAWLKDTLGAFYNWYAVNSGKLCPVGWHVPSDDEWHNLVRFLDPSATLSTNESNTAAIKMKVTGNKYWYFYPSEATNESGFSALGAGYRGVESISTGSDYFTGFIGAWWTSKEFDQQYSLGRSLNSRYQRVDRPQFLKWFGLSVRCIKDQSP